jgi:23S rRNA (uracil1939-C5)-methyltransferase
MVVKRHHPVQTRSMEARVEPLPLRPGCEPRCRGCRHRTWTAEASLTQKRAFIALKCAPWAAVLDEVQSVRGEARWAYRDKVTLHAAHDGVRWRLGLMSRDEHLPLEDCPIQSPRTAVLLHAAATLMPPPAAFPLAYWVQSGAQLVLIAKTHAAVPLDWVAALAPVLAAQGMEGLWLHRNPSAGRKLFMRSGWDLLWGEPRAHDAHGLWYGRAAFQQLIPVLHAQSLEVAEQFLAPTADDCVIDLYCGIGSSLRRWRARGARAIGVELAGEALECAALNAPGAELLRGTCITRLPQLDAVVAGLTRAPLAYLNPPRQGLESEVLEWLLTRARPQRLAYLSCSPGTLARDLRDCVAAGYRVTRLLPFDFFPQTHHVETLALLELGSPPD